MQTYISFQILAQLHSAQYLCDLPSCKHDVWSKKQHQGLVKWGMLLEHTMHGTVRKTRYWMLTLQENHTGDRCVTHLAYHTGDRCVTTLLTILVTDASPPCLPYWWQNASPPCFYHTGDRCVTTLAYLNEIKSSSLANVMTLLLSSFGTGNKYLRIFLTWNQTVEHSVTVIINKYWFNSLAK